ncbi:MAG: aminotransferase class I/II-fold pyridoxal phosphate-dependent enzyme [Micromonosporaceae bacterium]
MGQDCESAGDAAPGRGSGGAAGHDRDGLLDLASNDYLGLSRDPRLAMGAIQAARTWGMGATGSRLVSGTTTLHTALKSALATFAGAPGALVFSSGYLANLAEPDVVRTMTLSKALAGQGGAVLGAPEVVQTLIDTGRSHIFDTGLAPCAEHGIRVGCFRPPSVPPGRSCLRLAARPDLTDADLETVSRALAVVRDHAPQAAVPGQGGSRP